MKPYLLLFAACAMSGIAIPVPEDLTLLAAGMTLDDPRVFPGMALAAVLGVLCRDSVFFGIGHLVGEGVFRWRLVQRLIGEARIERGRRLVAERGGRAVLTARFLVGFRSTAFLVAGAMGVRVRDFLFWDVLGAVVGVPVVLGLGMVLGVPLSGAVEWLLEHKVLLVGLAALIGLAWLTRAHQRQAEEPHDVLPEPDDLVDATPSSAGVRAP